MTPLDRKSELKRTPMKRSQPRRNWKQALLKRESEGYCRVCCSPYDLEMAHILPREYDLKNSHGTRVVQAENIVPLCADHHRAYDENQLDLLPYLYLKEQGYAAGLIGIEAAKKRISGRDSL